MSRLLSLRSIHDILAAEQLFLAAGSFRFDLIPTPTHLSSECGMVIEVADESEATALALLAEAGLPVIGNWPG